MSSKLFKPSLVSRIISARGYTTSLDVGTAGSIRAAGGAFGRLEAAREQDYFLRKQHEQLTKLKMLKENQNSMELSFRKQIGDLEDELQRHKDSLRQLRTK